MLTKRIIPCLDIKDGRTVKGVNFVNIRDAGDPVELGALYAREGADELYFSITRQPTRNEKHSANWSTAFRIISIFHLPLEVV